MEDINKKIKEVETQLSKLEEQRKHLLDAQRVEEERQQKLEALVNGSGYTNARDLVIALISKYGIRIASSDTAKKTTRRTRTRITAHLRDAIKAEVAGGKKKLAVAKDRNISYTVVNKIVAGSYDSLA